MSRLIIGIILFLASAGRLLSFLLEKKPYFSWPWDSIENAIVNINLGIIFPILGIWLIYTGHKKFTKTAK